MKETSADSADMDSPEFHAKLARSCDAAAKTWLAKHRVFVGAPLNAGAYPKGFRAGDCKTHVFELRGSRPLRVLCNKVALSSYYEDTTQHVAPANVSCPVCASRFRKLPSSDGSAKR